MRLKKNPIGFAFVVPALAALPVGIAGVALADLTLTLIGTALGVAAMLVGVAGVARNRMPSE